MNKISQVSQVSQVREIPPSFIEHSAEAMFVVYQIQNGYLLQPNIRHSVGLGSLVYCTDIQDLTNQILSTQAQMRLNLK